MTGKSTIPRLPREYVDREGERGKIEELLREPGTRVAVYGLPGMGKTATAAKIAADAQSSLPGSLHVEKVLWADLGQEADPVDVLRRWCRELDAEVPHGDRHA